MGCFRDSKQASCVSNFLLSSEYFCCVTLPHSCLSVHECCPTGRSIVPAECLMYHGDWSFCPYPMKHLTITSETMNRRFLSTSISLKAGPHVLQTSTVHYYNNMKYGVTSCRGSETRILTNPSAPFDNQTASVGPLAENFGQIGLKCPSYDGDRGYVMNNHDDRCLTRQAITHVFFEAKAKLCQTFDTLCCPWYTTSVSTLTCHYSPRRSGETPEAD